MQDEPSPHEVLAAVAAFLRSEVMAAVPAHLTFHVRVAANAVDLVRRELELAPGADAAESARLTELLGRSGNLKELNGALADGLASGSVEVTPALTQHLWDTTLEKLAVDQPAYAAFKRAKAPNGR